MIKTKHGMNLFLGVSYTALVLALMFLGTLAGAVVFFVVLGVLTWEYYRVTVREEDADE